MPDIFDTLDEEGGNAVATRDIFDEVEATPARDIFDEISSEPEAPSQPVSDILRRIPSGIATAGAETIAGLGKIAEDISPLTSFLNPVAGELRQVGVKPGQWAQDFFRAVSEEAPKTYGVDQQFDSTIPSKLVGGASSIASAVASGPLAPVTMAAMMGESGRKDAASKGATDKQQNVSFYANAAIGAITEATLGIPALIRSARSGTAAVRAPRLLDQAQMTAVREGVQELAQNTGSNLVASEVSGYDPERAILEGGKESLLLGAAVGAPVGAVIQGAANRDASREIPLEVPMSERTPSETTTFEDLQRKAASEEPPQLPQQPPPLPTAVADSQELAEQVATDLVETIATQEAPVVESEPPVKMRDFDERGRLTREVELPAAEATAALETRADSLDTLLSKIQTKGTTLHDLAKSPQKAEKLGIPHNVIDRMDREAEIETKATSGPVRKQADIARVKALQEATRADLAATTASQKPTTTPTSAQPAPEPLPPSPETIASASGEATPVIDLTQGGDPSATVSQTIRPSGTSNAASITAAENVPPVSAALDPAKVTAYAGKLPAGPKAVVSDVLLNGTPIEQAASNAGMTVARAQEAVTKARAFLGTAKTVEALPSERSYADEPGGREWRTDEIDERVKGESEGPGAANASEFPPQKTTGLKRAVVDTERLARGAEPIPTVARQAEEAVVQAAEDRVDADPTIAPALVSRIVDNGERAITEQDAATLLVERARVMNERATWEERLGNGEDVATARTRLSEIETELERIDQAQRAAGSTWGRLGHMYQRMIQEDFTLAGMERKMRAKLERPLTESERATIKEQADKISELQKKAEEANTVKESAAVDAEVERLYEATINELGKDYLAKPQFGKDVFDIAQGVVNRWKAEAETAHKDLRKALGLQLAGIPNPAIVLHVAKIMRAKIGEFGLKRAEVAAEMLAEFGTKIKPHLNAAWEKAQAMISAEKVPSQAKEVVKRGTKKKGEATPGAVRARAKAEATAGEELSHKTVYDLARAHINAGVHGEGPVMAAVLADLKPLYEGLTERDVRRAFSEYGKVKLPSQEATAKELAELRNLTRLQESIDRLTEGRDAMKTGLQRDKATQAVREKQKQLNELLKTRQGPPSPEKLASREEAKQTALRNAIADLDKQLRTGEKPPGSQPAPDSVATEQLRAERDAMRAKLQEIEDAANPGKTAAEKQVEALAKIRDRIDDTLAGKRDPTAPKDFDPLSAAAADLKAEILAMQELAAQMRRDAKPVRDPSSHAEALKIRALEKAIANYEAKLAANDFSTKGPKVNRPDTAQAAALREIRDARIDAYNAAKKAGRPVRTKEEIYNTTRAKAIAKQLADVRARIAAGNFTREAKSIPPAKTKEVIDAEFALNKEKQRFNDGVFKAELAQRSTVRKALEGTRDVLNTARSVMTSFDLSAVLRQGGFISFGHPVRAAKALPAMFRAMVSEKAQFAVNKEISERPNAPLYASSKLHITDPNNPRLSKMEEQYMSRWSSKIPGVAHSERAYTTFLNRLRADSFDAMAKSIGRPMSKEESDAISNFINVATGRGNLAGASGAAISLNTAFFAPRYVVSRFELLAGQPLYRGTADTRIAVAKEYARFLVGIGTIYALAQAIGWEVEKDPRSADFGKLKIGNTRLDFLAGLSQATVLVSRLVSGETKTAAGIKEIRGDKIKFGQPDSSQVVGRFLRTKLSPVVGGAIDAASGTNLIGEKVTPVSAITRMVVPMTFGDIRDAIEDQGVERGVAMSLLSLFGVSLQTYEAKETSKK